MGGDIHHWIWKFHTGLRTAAYNDNNTPIMIIRKVVLVEYQMLKNTSRRRKWLAYWNGGKDITRVLHQCASHIRHPHLLGGALSARYYGMHDLCSVHVPILYMYSIPLYSYFIIMLETLEREICLSQNTGTVWSNQVN